MNTMAKTSSVSDQIAGIVIEELPHYVKEIKKDKNLMQMLRWTAMCVVMSVASTAMVRYS